MPRPQRFAGDVRDLQNVVAYLRLEYELHFLGIGYWRFRLKNGAILNFWPSTQTINFQGPPKKANELRKALARIRGQR